MKIDIEGAEYFALQGMVKTIEKFKPVILVEIQPFFLKGMGVEESDLIKLLTEQLGYEVFALKKGEEKLNKVNGALWDDNYILIHSHAVGSFQQIIQ